MRASDADLEALHRSIAATLKQELDRYSSGYYDRPEEGPAPTPVPAALIASTIRYLKDNGIDRPDEEEPDPTDLLADELPTFEDR